MKKLYCLHRLKYNLKAIHTTCGIFKSAQKVCGTAAVIFADVKLPQKAR
jgi:hypothetical protein